MPEFTIPSPEQRATGTAPVEIKEAIELVASEVVAPAPAPEASVKPVSPLVPVSKVSSPAQQPRLSPLEQKVEDNLAEGLEGLYRELNPAEQIAFKAGGESTAKKITLLLQQVKVKVGEVLKLIRLWLLNIPGVNKYFVEQTAKIKADKILKLRS